MVRELIYAQEEIETPRRKLWVSTCNTFDHGWETIIAPFKPNGEPDTGLLAQVVMRYDDLEEAGKGHDSFMAALKSDPDHFVHGLIDQAVKEDV